MKNNLLILLGGIFFISTCRMPSDPLGEIKIIKRWDTITTIGKCLDLDVNDSIIVTANNFDGFTIFNLYDSFGNFNPKQKYHGSDLDPTTSNDQISKVVISDSLAVIVLMDKKHRIYVNRLDGSPIFYFGVGDCFDGLWTDFSLDEGSTSLKLFTIVEHNLASQYDVPLNSKSIVWRTLENFSPFPTATDNIGSINCEFSLNLSDEAGKIHFSDDGLLSIGIGELGMQIYKQLDNSTCYNKIETEVENRVFYVDISDINISGWNWKGTNILANSVGEAPRNLLVLDMDDEPQNILNIQFYDPQDNLINMTYNDENNSGNPNRLWFEKEDDYYYIKFKVDTEIARFHFTIPDVANISLMTDQYFPIDEFNYTDNYDDDQSECGDDGDGYIDYLGIYEPMGGINPNPLLEYDTPGEILSVYSVNHSIFTGLSKSNGLLVTNINEDGSIIYQATLAQGYSVNNIFVNDNLIGLAVGHDGALIYSWDGNTSFILIGRLETSYANAIKINDNVIYIATEEGIEIVIIDY